MTKKKWYKWPQGYSQKNYKPWYGIIRTLFGAPFVYVGFSVTYIGVILADGLEEAEYWRKELF